MYSEEEIRKALEVYEREGSLRKAIKRKLKICRVLDIRVPFNISLKAFDQR